MRDSLRGVPAAKAGLFRLLCGTAEGVPYKDFADAFGLDVSDYASSEGLFIRSSHVTARLDTENFSLEFDSCCAAENRFLVSIFAFRAFKPDRLKPVLLGSLPLRFFLLGFGLKRDSSLRSEWQCEKVCLWLVRLHDAERLFLGSGVLEVSCA